MLVADAVLFGPTPPLYRASRLLYFDEALCQQRKSVPSKCENCKYFLYSPLQACNTGNVYMVYIYKPGRKT